MTNIKFDSISGSSMLLYEFKHDGRGGRRRPLSPATNPENHVDTFGKDRPTSPFNFSQLSFQRIELTK